MPKPRVYETRIGFHDAVVAAPNQKAALAAWDVRENLFAQGAARITEDLQAIEAASAQPSVVLRRPAGSSEPFSASPGAPAVPKLARPPGKTPRPAKPPPAKPKPDRSALDAAEKALKAFEAEAEQRRKTVEREIDTRRKALQRDLEMAQRAYARAGGR